MISIEDIRSYHCLRWSELPDLELYMDQVMSVLERSLKIFIGDDPQKTITPTMINNYVKQKMVPPPKNKRYNKGHIASFFIITLLKQIMSMAQISRFIGCIMQDEGGYDRFCEILEASLELVFFNEKAPIEGKTDADSMTASVTLAFANMLHAEYQLDILAPVEAPEVKEKKKKDVEKHEK